MKKDIPSISTNLPNGADAFVFGSAKNSVSPSDLDVLIVYDSTKIAPERASYMMTPFLVRLASAAHLKVHPVILSQSEELQVRFAETEKAMPFEAFWKSFCTSRSEKCLNP